MIIDHVEGLEIPESDVPGYGNELGAIAYLAQGLNGLAATVAASESEVFRRLPPNQRHTMMGNAPLLDGAPQGLIACMFHWYATSACNMVRLIGWLGFERDHNKARDYVERVLPVVLVWRNKVGAHFAQIDPRPSDTPADLAKSVMFPIGWDDDSWIADPLTLTMGSATGGKSSSRNMQWSLTHVHRGLVDRYRPGPTGVELPE